MVLEGGARGDGDRVGFPVHAGAGPEQRDPVASMVCRRSSESGAQLRRQVPHRPARRSPGDPMGRRRRHAAVPHLPATGYRGLPCRGHPRAIGGASGRPSGSLSPHAPRGRHHHAGLLQARRDLHADFLWLWGGGGGGAGAGLRGDAAGDSRRLHPARRVGEDEASRG